MAETQEILFHRFQGFEPLIFHLLEQKGDCINLWLLAVLPNYLIAL